MGGHPLAWGEAEGARDNDLVLAPRDCQVLLDRLQGLQGTTDAPMGTNPH